MPAGDYSLYVLLCPCIELTLSGECHDISTRRLKRSTATKEGRRQRGSYFCGPSPASVPGDLCYFCGRIDNSIPSTIRPNKLEVSTRACCHRKGCTNTVNICETCVAAQHVVCAACYRRHWNDKCFKCRRNRAQRGAFAQYCKTCHPRYADLKRSKKRKSANSSKLRRRRLDANCPSKCYYCGLVHASDATLTKTCNQIKHCKTLVPMCSKCAAVNNRIVCPACYRRRWKGRCFKCNVAVARRGQCGQYCKNCFVEITGKVPTSTSTAGLKLVSKRPAAKIEP